MTHLLMDSTHPNRIAGAVGFSVRDGNFYVFRAKAVIVSAGGASHIYRPRAIGEGTGRTWYAPWSSASAYGLLIPTGAKMIQMENRIVLARFKDGYGPVGAWFLLLKAYATNAYGEKYEAARFDEIKALVGKYAEIQPMPTCLRNHAMLEEMKAGKGPIYMQTQQCLDTREKEEMGWEDFPRHDDRSGGDVGVAEHRSEGKTIGAGHIRTVRDGLPCHVFGRLGEWTGGLRAGRLSVGIQPDDDG